MYSVRSIVEYFTRYASTGYLCAIDLSKAFYKVNLHALFIKLMKRNIPVELLSMIEVLTDPIVLLVSSGLMLGPYLSKLILESDRAQFSLHIYLPCTYTI